MRVMLRQDKSELCIPVGRRLGILWRHYLGSRLGAIAVLQTFLFLLDVTLSFNIQVKPRLARVPLVSCL